MSGNCELGRGLRRREKNANEAGAGRFEKPAPDARAAPPEAHESLISRKTVEEVPLTGLSFGWESGTSQKRRPRSLCGMPAGTSVRPLAKFMLRRILRRLPLRTPRFQQKTPVVRDPTRGVFVAPAGRGRHLLATLRWRAEHTA